MCLVFRFYLSFLAVGEEYLFRGIGLYVRLGNN